MECIEILDSDEEAAANNAQAPPESDDDVEIVGGAPAPVPDSQDSEVQILDDAADLSEGAQAKLLKSLLAEKQQLAQQVASLQKKTSDDKRTKRPVYWRRDGDGARCNVLTAVYAVPGGFGFEEAFDKPLVMYSHNLRLTRV